MTHKIIIMLLIGLFVGAVPGTILAVGYDSTPGRNANEAGDSASADMWPASEQVETGAVPEMKSSPSLIDTHFDPFHPEQREIDRAGSAGGE